MSAATQKRTRPAPVVAGMGWPQVNLLPPEVKAARGLRHVKQWLAVALLLVLVLAAAGFGLAVMAQSAADQSLADAQGEAATLRTQEDRYAEVQPIVSGLRRTTEARITVTAPEILWRPYFDAIAAVLPPNTSIDTFTMAQGSVAFAAPAAPDALTLQGVATLQFTSRAAGLPDSAAWVDALNSIPGFYGATTSADILGEVDGVVGYDVTSMVQVDTRALALRFPAMTDGEDG